MYQLSVLRVAASIAVACLSVISSGAIATDPVRLLPESEAGYGHLTVRATDAVSGRPLPVRARLAPRGLRGSRRLGVAESGRLDMEIAAGDYDLFVTHGPEWSIVKREVSLRARETLEIQATLRREVDAAGYTACDLHVHSDASPDGDLALAERVDSLLAEDVQFAVITDHNHVTRASELLTAAGIGSLPGLEVTTWAPEFGHFNVFPRSQVPRFKHSNPARLLAELRRDPRAFVQINHPRLETHIGYFELEQQVRHADRVQRPAFDGLEVWNGFDLTRPERRDRVFREWLGMIAHGQRLVATGGSDSHHLRPPHVGYPRTYVHVPRDLALDGERVLAALKQGRAFVSSGPILALSVAGRGPGETVRVVGDSVAVTIEADAPDWMDLQSVEIWLGRERVLSAPIPPRLNAAGPRARLRFDVRVGDQRSLVAVVRGERGMEPLLERSNTLPYAFTNPVWLERAE